MSALSSVANTKRDSLSGRAERLDPALVRQIRGADYEIPSGFRREITLHLLLNELVGRDLVPLRETPLVLGVQGPPGVGKSWETQTVCAERGVTLYSISGSSLSGDFEGDSAESLLTAYRVAATDDSSSVALLIDDLDTSPAGNFGEATTYTVNRQLLCGALMSLADLHDQSVPRRVPIIATANDLTRLYLPLTRHGRMSIYDYPLSVADLVSKAAPLVRRILPSIRIADLQALVGNQSPEPAGPAASTNFVPSLSVAFFADLCVQAYRSALASAVLDESKKDDSIPTLVERFHGNRHRLDDHLAAIHGDEFQRLAKRLQDAHIAKAYV